MSSHLERFVQDHRDQFDDESPAPELWDKIRDRMQGAAGKAGEKKEAPVRSLSIKRWLSAAAAVVLVCASGWIYFSHRQKPAPQPLAIISNPGQRIRISGQRQIRDWTSPQRFFRNQPAPGLINPKHQMQEAGNASPERRKTVIRGNVLLCQTDRDQTR